MDEAGYGCWHPAAPDLCVWWGEPGPLVKQRQLGPGDRPPVGHLVGQVARSVPDGPAAHGIRDPRRDGDWRRVAAD